MLRHVAGSELTQATAMFCTPAHTSSHVRVGSAICNKFTECGGEQIPNLATDMMRVNGKSPAEYLATIRINSSKGEARSAPRQPGQSPFAGQEIIMLRWAVTFFVIAIVAAVLGFGGIAAGASEIARILFFVFLAIFVATLIMGMMRR
jgi:uncharacterized membrane protein YtjA (UPF0391 family)